MTEKRLTFESPYGCKWCGIERRRHGRQWTAIIGMHSWIEPAEALIKERMWWRLEFRLYQQPPVYHQTTAWEADSTGEEGIPFCADCKTDACPKWTRIQTRLDQQRFGMPRWTRRRRKNRAWGASESLPF